MESKFYKTPSAKNHLCTSSVIVRDGKILLGLRNYHGGSYWIAPGGRCDVNETPKQTVLREIAEEVGITDAKIVKRLGEKKGTYEDECGADRVVVFEISTDQEPRLLEPEKFSEWRWFSFDELPENLMSPVEDRAFFKQVLPTPHTINTPYDAIIILSGGVNDDGSIPLEVERRTKLGVERFKSGDAPVIILSGGWGYRLEKPQKITEAEAMRRFAIELGVPEDAILTEENSHDTVGNAYFTKINILKPRNWSHILIVTSDYPVVRSEYIFKKVLGPQYKITVIGAPSDPELRSRRDAFETKSLAVHRQWFDPISDGDDETIWNLLSTKHPAYAINPEFSKEQLLQSLLPKA